ncbi:MAG: hydroxyacylglutathione hydrolase [Geminocystis sp.]|nr:hydroxyacylglutathione hydrolase [Geminocystis sp.]HIK37747.1 hydroxyacylglutathione hydrolase [Geminocystis sp. M7585_C2015_104]MCS7148944.1 hydroxyacylglutathione hydrolase [Geminocystis sp.]MCX8077433.1 hydroxyacylglutathione hydrolase [Geminocystis sp.]MDW8117209.1 hydroxyacylglutathione hydrolase [Geminocystis sp.]
MEILTIPVLSDNYVFLLYDSHSKQVAVVDPSVARPVLREIDKLGAELIAIFNTHHHWDHVGGNQELLARFPQATVYGGREDKGRIPRQDVFLQEGDTVEFGGRKAYVYHLPGHTKGHIAYYFPPTEGEEGELFCGDTLFAGGCGRLFEGTPAQMVQSLNKLRSLPDSTRVWCAHEYTLKNLQFALTVDRHNEILRQRYQQVVEDRKKNLPTIPSTIGLEKLTNPFLRWDDPNIKSTIGLQEPERVFARLRGMKDNF